MNNKNFLRLINEKELNYRTKEQLVKELAIMLGKSEGLIKQEVESLITNGDMFLFEGTDRYVTIQNFLNTTGAKYDNVNKGVISVNQNSCYCDCEDGKSYRIKKEDLNTANDGDTVIVVPLVDVDSNRERAKVIGVISRKKNSIVGTLSITKQFAIVKPDDNAYVGRKIIIDTAKLKNAKSGDKVVVKINKYKNNIIEGEINEVLGKGGDINAEVLSIVREFSLIEEFPQEVELAASKVSKIVSKSELKGRLDLRGKNIFTIDGIDAKDLDDAVDIRKNDDGTFVLGVHIADVAHYVNILGDKIGEEAYRRGTSVYFPNAVLPMLPRQLSNGICSLNEKVDRLTLSCIMKIDRHGDVIDHKICESVIKSVHRMNYDDVQKIIEGDEMLCKKYSDIADDINDMIELSNILQKKREKRGGIDFDLPELKIILDKDLKIQTFKIREHNDAEKLIESFMIAANECVAEHYEEKGLPFVYRVHDEPDILKMQAFRDFVAGFGFKFNFDKEDIKGEDFQNFLDKIEDTKYKEIVNKFMLRTMKKAKYSPNCTGHFGLGSQFYTHFTSPIRRFPDLTIHSIIKEDLHNRLHDDNLLMWERFVYNSSTRSSSTELTADKCEREVDDYFKAIYMKDKIGQKFTGKISGITHFGLFVEIENGVEGLLPIENLPFNNYLFDEKKYQLIGKYHKFYLCQPLDVRVAEVNPIERKISFAYAEQILADDFASSPKGSYKNSKSSSNGENRKRNNNPKRDFSYSNISRQKAKKSRKYRRANESGVRDYVHEF